MSHHRINIRLTAAERAAVDNLTAALATPLMPNVTASDVFRAGLRALQDRIADQRGALGGQGGAGLPGPN